MRIYHLGSIIYYLNKAYLSLKTLFDPAAEGNPYITDQHGIMKKTRIHAEKDRSWLPRKKFAWR